LSRGATIVGVRLVGLTVLEDVSSASWLVDQLRPWGPAPATIASFLPTTFESYGRLLHPAYRRDASGHLESVRWRDITTPPESVALTAMTGFHERLGIPPQTLNGDDVHVQQFGVHYEPTDGGVDRNDLTRLTTVLTDWTSTPHDVWFCIWEGYGWPELPAPRDGPPRVRLPHRNHFLCHGDIDGALELPHDQAPTLWWPNDRAWCVSTEVDGCSTYIDAGQTCLEALRTDPSLEVIPASIDDSLASDSRLRPVLLVGRSPLTASAAPQRHVPCWRDRFF
jgi:hypothetical protein